MPPLQQLFQTTLDQQLNPNDRSYLFFFFPAPQSCTVILDFPVHSTPAGSTVHSFADSVQPIENRKVSILVRDMKATEHTILSVRSALSARTISLFVLAKTIVDYYCWLVWCERKILFYDQTNRLNHDIIDMRLRESGGGLAAAIPETYIRKNRIYVVYIKNILLAWVFSITHG